MKTILVVEDEPSMLMFLEEGLQDGGFAVVSARSGGEALSILGSSVYDIAVLVTDVRLGAGVDGWEIARAAREITPALPIVYVTGEGPESWNAEGVDNSRLLQKPFTCLELGETIENLLAHARA